VATAWRRHGLAPWIVAVGLAPGGAYAATAVADNSDQTTATVSEIIVVAQKREENIQRVPIAMSAYTAKQRDLLGIDTIQDVAKFTPGLDYSGGLDRAYIRGVGRQTNNLSTQPGVASYFDGVYNGATFTVSGDSLFLDHLEVLRGPQGTLYGKNAIGGTIDAISRRPTNDFYAEARANIGSYGVNDFEAAVSGPINENVRFRLAGYRNDQQQGYYENVAGLGSEGGSGVVNYLEGQLDAKIGSSVDVWVKADAVSWDVTRTPAVSPSPYDTSEFPPGVLSPTSTFGFTQPGFTEVGTATSNPGVTNLRSFSANTRSRAQLSNDYTGVAQVTWHTPWAADLKYIGGYTQYLYRQGVDADGTSLTTYDFPTVPSPVCLPQPECPPLEVFGTDELHYFEDKAYFSNELDLTSTSKGPLQWIVGLYEYHEAFTQGDDFDQPFQPQLSTPVNGAPNPSRDLFNNGQRVGSDSYAGFAQVDWSVTPQLKFSGGLRDTRDSEAVTEQARLICFGSPNCGPPAAIFGALTPVVDITQFAVSFAPAPGVVGPTTLDPATGFYSRKLAGSWGGLTGTAGAEWTPDAQTLIYAKYARGYKSGAFNGGNLLALPETQPEFLDDYEAGFKRDFGRTLRLDVAAFYYNYHGMQIPLMVQPPNGPAIQEFVNMKQVVSYGLELETTWRPTNDLQIIFNYGYLSAKVRAEDACFIDGVDPFAVQPGANTSGCPAGGSQSVIGQTVPNSPRNKLALGGTYSLHFSKAVLTLAGSYAWTDQTYYSIFNRPYYRAPAFDDVDLRLILSDLAGRYTLIAYGKNVFNKLGYEDAGAGLQGNGMISLAYSLTPPATYGVELQYRFR
jgi:iron complex outermembrane receptor protein